MDLMLVTSFMAQNLVQISSQFFSEQVTERLKGFFNSRLDHTGFKPPVNLQADKGKNIHRTRQSKSVVQVFPNFPNC